MTKLFTSLVSLIPIFSLLLAAQSAPSPVERTDNIPIFRVTVVSRTTKAVNYRHHSGGTKLSFRGTELMPEAKGEARVESRTGRIEIDANLENLREARSYGPEYLTYVIWAITPEGRAANLGEIVPKDNKSSVKVSTDLQAFGLIVTAEPYFAVTRPSDLIVLENVVEPHTKGWEQPIDAKFDLLERGQYTVSVRATELPATYADPKTPTDLLEARNAVAIARATGAETYAADTLRKAQDFLDRAEDYLRRGENEKAIGTVARGATQAAEDARILTIRKREEEQRTAERRALEDREAQARLEAAQAQREGAEAQLRAELEARERDRAEAERRAAESERRAAERAKAEADVARAAALEQQRAAEAQTEQARLAAMQAQQQADQATGEREEARARLLQQLNQVLQTRESARGLIVNMPDVLFDTGRYTLKPAARERLATVAGILLAYPNLQIEVEGHTDNVGSEDYNQRLSENRAAAVRDFLLQQGVGMNNIVARGFGEAQPVASNLSSSGRQQNRRVDLVVSGEAIGASAGYPSESGMNGSSVPAATSPGLRLPGGMTPATNPNVPATTPPPR